MISIILPTLNEERQIENALEAIAAQRPTSDEDGAAPFETIVVDGGSSDRTVELAVARGVKVVHSAPGRGQQMNSGARAASGDVFLFLHADSRLPVGALAAVAEVMATTDAPGGGFLKRYDTTDSWLLRLTGAVLNAVRSRVLRALVGTQAMFVRREVFQRLGGFREWPLLEDVDLSDRLRAVGRPAILPLEVVASARRYRSRGVMRQVILNGIVLGLFRLGVGPERLERIYQGLR